MYASLILIAGYGPDRTLSLPTLTVPVVPGLNELYDSFNRASVLGMLASLQFFIFGVVLGYAVIRASIVFRSNQLSAVGIFFALSASLFTFLYFWVVSISGLYYVGWAIQYSEYLLTPYPGNEYIAVGVVSLVLVGITMVSYGSFFIANHRHFRSGALQSPLERSTYYPPCWYSLCFSMVQQW